MLQVPEQGRGQPQWRTPNPGSPCPPRPREAGSGREGELHESDGNSRCRPLPAGFQQEAEGAPDQHPSEREWKEPRLLLPQQEVARLCRSEIRPRVIRGALCHAPSQRPLKP